MGKFTVVVSIPWPPQSSADDCTAMDKLLFWVGLGAAQKGAGSKPSASRHPFISFVVGILLALSHHRALMDAASLSTISSARAAEVPASSKAKVAARRDVFDVGVMGARESGDNSGSIAAYEREVVI